MTTHNFVTTHISFSSSDAVSPKDLPVGHLIDKDDMLAMAKVSTTPHVDAVTGEDFFLVVSAGITHDIETNNKGWMIELMDEAGDTFILRGTSVSPEGLKVTPSRKPWSMF